MKIGVIIPWRAQPSRIKAFEAVVSWYKTNLPDATIYYPNHPGKVWLPSHTRNDGVRMAEKDGCDVIILNDADTIPQIRPLQKAIIRARADNRFHNPYTHYRMLQQMGTEQFFSGKPIHECSYKSFNSACWGTVVCTPRAWWDLGGMDEKFMQWGYEDTAMQVAHQIIKGSPFIKHPGIVFALGHDEQPRNTSDFHNNQNLFNKYTSVKTPEEMLELVAIKDLKSLYKAQVEAQQVTSMHILAYVRLYPPMTNSGGELMLHQILVELRKRGHNVRVLCDKPTVDSLDGIELFDVNTSNVNEVVAWSSLVITQLEFTPKAISAALKKKPIVHMLHNDMALRMYRINQRNANLLIANSSWVSKKSRVGVPCVIVNPPTDIEQYKVKNKGTAITLINLNANKGAEIFWQLARILPDRKFIGVKGGYGKQIVYDKPLKNVTIYENNPNIKKIYEQTRILLMPSEYESWGRTAMEAAASGIPTIASQTEGLSESLGDAGIFIDRSDIAGFVEAIRMLDDVKTYNKYSAAVYDRVSSLDTALQIDQLELALLRLV